MEVNLYEFGTIPDLLIKYVVILVRQQDKWVLSMHKDRTTWEFAGGHREKGESIDVAARRELFEETGAVDFSLIPVSIYSVTHENQQAESFGQLYIATVNRFDPLPDFEMSEVRTFEHIPENLTYPHIYPKLIKASMMHLTFAPKVMKYDFNREWLLKKFEEIRRRTLKAIEQLSEVQLNRKPDEYSHNIPILLKHIEGNMIERVRKGILKEDITRDVGHADIYMTKPEAELSIESTIQIIIEVIKNCSDETLEELQTVRGKQRTNLDMLHQCAAHYSEHMGQIFYITKVILKDKYTATSL